MRISNDPSDRDYVGGRTFVVVLDRKFFTQGPVLVADEAAGEIMFLPVDEEGRNLFDPTNGCWRVEQAKGQVLIFEQGGRC
jgi:hypothetical protein